MIFAAFETLPGFLRGEELRNWLRTDGAGLLASFDTGSAALAYIRELGAAIRTSDFYSIYNDIWNTITSSAALWNYADNQLIPLNWHTKNHGLDLSTDFQYRIHVFGADLIDGALKDSWMTVASDRQLTKDQIREVARSYIGEGGVSGDLTNYIMGEIEALRM